MKYKIISVNQEEKKRRKLASYAHSTMLYAFSLTAPEQCEITSKMPQCSHWQYYQNEISRKYKTRSIHLQYYTPFKKTNQESIHWILNPENENGLTMWSCLPPTKVEVVLFQKQ